MQEGKKFLIRRHHIVAVDRSIHSRLAQHKHDPPPPAGITNLLFELSKGLPFAAICMLWGAQRVLVGDLRLSRFMSSTQDCADDVALFCGKVLIESYEFADVLNFLEGPQCPAVWGVFPWHFPAPCVESTLLSGEAGGLDCFEFGVFRRSLHVFLLWCRGRVAVRDRVTDWSGFSSAAPLELLGCDRLKGIGLVQGFFFLALPWRNTHNSEQ